MESKAGYTDDGNFYLIDGVRKYARVTHVIDASDPDTSTRRALEGWRARVGDEEADRISKETADAGDQIHNITLLGDVGADRSVTAALKKDPWLVPFLVAWDVWTLAYVKRWVAREVIVWSKKMGVAGRIDGVGVMKGDKNATIVDIKTGSLHDSIGVQVYGAYVQIYNEWRPRGWPKADRALVVHMPRKNPGHLATREYGGQKYIDRFQEAIKTFHQINQ